MSAANNLANKVISLAIVSIMSTFLLNYTADQINHGHTGAKNYRNRVFVENTYQIFCPSSFVTYMGPLSTDNRFRATAVFAYTSLFL